MELVKRFLGAIAGSKKAVAVVATVLFVLLNPLLMKLGIEVSKDQITDVVQLVMAYLVGQGLADLHKEKAKIEAASKEKS